MKRIRRTGALVAGISIALAVWAGGGQMAEAGGDGRVGVHGPRSGKAVDRAFIRGMVPHHAAAIEMAKAERDKGKRPEVKEVAQAIIDAQEREIAELTAIARQRYGFTPARRWHGAMGTLMGMRLSSDMAMMGEEVAKAPDPDMAFLMMMRPHHAAAIVMADEEMRRGTDADLKKIADMIVADQSKELGRIQQLLGAKG